MPVIDDLSRFDRLILGWGEEAQQKVAEAYISVITEGYLGKYIASYLVSAGFGNFRLVGNNNLNKGERFLWAIPLKEKNQVMAYSQAFPILCPGIEIQSIRGRMNNDFMKDQLRNSNVIVDATNEPESKAWTLDTALTYDLPAISVSCNSAKARLQVFNPKNKKDYMGREGIDARIQFLMKDFEGTEQDELVAMAFAGVVDEQVKRFVLGEKVTMSSLEYFIPKYPARNHFKRYHVLLVGCGAAANPGAYALARMGFNIDGVDKDPIDSTNMPRVPLFIDPKEEYIGQQKAKVLAKQLKKIFPDILVRGFEQLFDSSFKSDISYDIIIDMVDNDVARGQAHEYAIKHRIPHLSIGTMFDGFNYALAVPGKTVCMKHYIPGFEEQVKRSEAMIRASCMQTLPSNSWMQSSAVLGVLQIPTALFPEAGEPFNGMVYYDAKHPTVSELKAATVCDCYGKR